MTSDPTSRSSSPEPSADHLTQLRDAARVIVESAAGTTLDERELVTRFVQAGFFAALGYDAVGEDIRLEQHVGRGRADVILRSFTGRPIALLEFKRPDTNLTDHLPQLQAEDGDRRKRGAGVSSPSPASKRPRQSACGSGWVPAKRKSTRS